MIIRVFKDAKDRQLGPKHETVSRRDFIQRGLFTTTMAAALPTALATELTQRAFADTTTCPPQVLIPGGIAQLHGPGGGFAIQSYLLDATQAEMAASSSTSSAALNLWGIQGGSNIVACFAGGAGVDSKSAAGATILTPPPGLTQATWNKALAQCSFAANNGAASADDGGGENLGHIGAVSPYKQSLLNTDLLVNGSVSLANWASGLGSIAKVSGSPTTQTSANFAKGFGITPSTGTTGAIFSNTATAASSLGALFNAAIGSGRAGTTNALTAASCGFIGDSGLASSTFGTQLFTPSQIPAISGFAGLNIASLSAAEQAFLAAFYESDIGKLGLVTALNNGADYHNQSVQANIAPYDINFASQIRMWILAAYIANVPAAMIISTNGSPGPNGFQQVTVNGVSGSATAQVTVNGPLAEGDDGGSFSRHGLLTFTPVGTTPVQLTSTGTYNANGQTKPASNITSVPQSIGSLYYTAMLFLKQYAPSSGINAAGLEAVMVAKGDTPVSLIT